MVVPLGCAAGETRASAPPSTATFVPAPSPVEVVRQNAETLATEARASPRKPKVVTASRSETFSILLVACRSTESGASSGDIPAPSSRTRRCDVPPSPSSTSTLVAPASKEFSTSSLTTEAGRSTTSPAATCWATLGSRTLMLTGTPSSDCADCTTTLGFSHGGRCRIPGYAKRGREPAGRAAAGPGREGRRAAARERGRGDPGAPGGDGDLRKGDAGGPARGPLPPARTGRRRDGFGARRGGPRSERPARGPLAARRHVLPGARPGRGGLRRGGGHREGRAGPLHRRGHEDDERDRRRRLGRGRRGPGRELRRGRLRPAALPPQARGLLNRC